MGAVCTKDQEGSDEAVAMAEKYPQFSKARGGPNSLKISSHIRLQDTSEAGGGGVQTSDLTASAASPGYGSRAPVYGGDTQQQPDINWDAIGKEAQANNYMLLKKDYLENPDQFLANQLLLSVQLFKNFDRYAVV